MSFSSFLTLVAAVSRAWLWAVLEDPGPPQGGLHVGSCPQRRNSRVHPPHFLLRSMEGVWGETFPRIYPLAWCVERGLLGPKASEAGVDG